MSDWKKYFKGKKIVIMGLGLLGGALNDAIFLAEHGAELLITDLKSAEQLKSSLDKLKKYKNIKYVLGEHRLEDFRNVDMILQPGNVPLNSPYLAEARKNKIPIYVSESLFAENAEGVQLIGITGTRGKSTTTQLIYEILKKALPKRKIFLGGNVKNVSTLSLLEKTKAGDLVVMELDSWALHGMGAIKISPYIAVFTNIMDDHLNFYQGDRELYFKDKANIFFNQKKGDFLVSGKEVGKLIKEKFKGKLKSKMVSVDSDDIPKDWNVKLKGKHNLENISIAISVAKIFGISEKIAKGVVENFTGVSGRLEFVKKVRGISIFNDTTATTPDATIAGLEAVGENKNVILIMGGADKNLDMSKLVSAIPKYCKVVIFLDGSGTESLIHNPSRLGVFAETGTKYIIKKAPLCKTLVEAVEKAFKQAETGDVILFSPAFPSFGMFDNEFDRGEKFMEIIRELK